MKEKEIIQKILFEVISMREIEQKGINLLIDEYMPIPNTIGCVKKNLNWYLYTTDERNQLNIKGPFSLNGIIKALSLKLRVKVPETYNFNNDELNIYVDKNYNEFSEINTNEKKI